MRLVSLKICKRKNGEVIRDIKFNEYGLSLICDLESEENKAHGSSIGKTAFIRCIDICLGAKSVSALYRSNTLGTNEAFKEYLFANKVSLILVCEHKGGNILLERHVFDNKEYVNGEEFSDIDLYCQKLKNIFFPNSPSKISFRQMIPLFVRIDIEEPIKYLDKFAKNQQYNFAYSYFLNLYLDEKESLLQEEATQKKRALGKLEAKYKIKDEGDFEKLVQKKDQIVKEKLQAVRDADYVGSYASNDRENTILVDNLDKVTEELNAKKCKSRYLEKAIQLENEKLFEIDNEMLNDLYDDATKTIQNLKESFKDFCTFHNEMCKLRMNKFIEEKALIDEETKKLEIQVQESREKFNKGFVEYKVSVDEKEGSLFENYFSSKKDCNDTKAELAQYIELKQGVSEAESSLSKIEKKKETNIENIHTFSAIFEEKTEKLFGTSYKINYESKFDKMVVTINGPSGNPGTGDSKVMSYALNSSLYSFFVAKSTSMPLFAIQDRMENVEIAKLKRIVEDVRTCGIQYIVPILSDRIDGLGINEKEIVLKLSKDDKLFKF